MQQTCEVDGLLLVGGMVGIHDNEVGTADDVLQASNAHLGEILPHLLGEEREEVDHIVGTAHEACTEAFVLRSHTDGTGVGVAFAHHHATEHDERQCAECELIGTEHRHDDDVLGRLQLTIGLQSHLVAETVADERLLGFGKAYFGRNACKAHRTGGRGSCTTFGTADDDEVGLGLGYAGSDGSHTTFGHQLHAHGSLGVDVLQVEDELGEVLDAVDVVMRWGRNERDAWDGVARLGNDLVHLEAGQLSTLTGLGTLGNLDLYLLGIDQIFSSDTEASAGNLLGLAAEAYPIDRSMVTGIVLAAFAGVASRSQSVHG